MKEENIVETAPATEKKKKPYHPPKLTRYGNLAELTRAHGRVGRLDSAGHRLAKTQ